MEAFGSIREGVTINIQRSDGRIHQAVVTQLHVPSSSVSVEWCERNETKGKEIELEALYALNSTLLVINSLTLFISIIQSNKLMYFCDLKGAKNNRAGAGQVNSKFDKNNPF